MTSRGVAVLNKMRSRVRIFFAYGIISLDFTSRKTMRGVWKDPKNAQGISLRHMRNFRNVFRHTQLEYTSKPILEIDAYVQKVRKV